MKVAVIGGVRSTEVLIRKLHDHGFAELRVWGYAPADPRIVSGWADLGALCKGLGIAYQPFVKLAQCEDDLRRFEPDLLFAVGLSQILSPALLAIAATETIGFHPTALPRGRGRAAIAWIVLDGCPGAATFFGIREGVDDGPIYAQRPFAVDADDDASTVEARLLQAEDELLDEWLPAVAAGKLTPAEQDETAATWYGRRLPEDGWIDWAMPAESVLKLIRASTRPHPGALTAAGAIPVTIWSAQTDPRPEKGVAGRILQVDGDQQFTIQTGSGLLRVTKWSAEQQWGPKVGARLGYGADAEIFQLRARCSELERAVAALVKQLQRDAP